jgi:uncharacterized membrane protein
MRTFIPISIIAAALALAACGNTRGERVTTGVVGGALVGTAVGGPLVGAAAGGAVGAVTEQEDFR